MKVLFFLSHPAHYHLFKHVINNLKQHYEVQIIIVTKDVLEELVQRENWEYTNLFPEGRRIEGMPILLSTGINMFRTQYRLLKYVRRNKPDLMVGTEGTLAHIGTLLGITSFMVNEDDTSVTPENYIVYPFSDKIIVPGPVDPGMWGKKRVAYEGYHELAYLHPNYFKPNEEVVRKFNPDMERYSIIRLAQLTASHDIGHKGFNMKILKELVEFLGSFGKVFITSEAKLKEDFESYRLPVSVHDIHHALYYADMYLGDSQTMSIEAALLGTPAFRFNSFADKCSVILELHDKYDLVYSYFPTQAAEMFDKVKEILEMKDHKEVWRRKRDKMLSEKIDVTKWLTELIENELTRPEVRR